MRSYHLMQLTEQVRREANEAAVEAAQRVAKVQEDAQWYGEASARLSGYLQ